jgi:hypothetical protein
MAGFDLAMLALGALFAALAWYLSRRRSREVAREGPLRRLRTANDGRRRQVAVPAVKPASTAE